MGLRNNQGTLEFTKSGKGVQFVDKTRTWNSYFVASKKQVEDLLAGKRASVSFALIVKDPKVDEKFDA